MKEIWKLVEERNGFKGLKYYVSNLGRLKRVYNASGKTIIDYGTNLQKNRNGTCYKYCTIGQIHRLVAKAFIPNPDNLPEIDHIDGNPFNNSVDNLRWVSHKENMNNPITLQRLKGHHPSDETKQKRIDSFKKTVNTEEYKKKISKIRSKKHKGIMIRLTHIETNEIKEFDAITRASEYLGVSKQRLWNVLNSNKHIIHNYKVEKIFTLVCTS